MKPPIARPSRGLSQAFLGTVDGRIYAAVRIGFSLVALLNLATLWPDRTRLLSDVGMIAPTVTSTADPALPTHLSAFDLLPHSPAAVSAYLLFNALCLVLLLLGIAPRAAALAVYIWHLSFQAHAGPATTGWDEVLGAFSFLFLISPLGRSVSVLRPRRPAPPRSPAYGLVLMRLQVLVIYWQTVVLKLAHPAPFWREGDFLAYYLFSTYSRWPGTWILDWQGLLTLLTWSTLIVELAIPVLLFIRPTRRLGVALGLLLHLGICVVSHGLLLFALTMAMAYLAFLRDEDFPPASQPSPAPPQDTHHHPEHHRHTA